LLSWHKHPNNIVFHARTRPDIDLILIRVSPDSCDWAWGCASNSRECHGWDLSKLTSFDLVDGYENDDPNSQGDKE
jgi:hypothetical protein